MPPRLLVVFCALALAPRAMAAEAFSNPTSGGQITAAGMPDFFVSSNFSAASTSNALMVKLDGGKGVVAFQIVGLTASGATLVPEFTNDQGAHWSAGSLVSSGAIASTLTADGPAIMDAAGHTAVRLRVSVAGTGTISVAANASSVSADPVLRAMSGPVKPSASLTFATTIGISSTPLFSGGTASRNLAAFNNSTGTGAPILWCNPAGGTAVVGQGIPIPPYGGGYVWPTGLATVPACISAGPGSANVSGAGG